jgi:hypothetical protein
MAFQRGWVRQSVRKFRQARAPYEGRCGVAERTAPEAPFDKVGDQFIEEEREGGRKRETIFRWFSEGRA